MRSLMNVLPPSNARNFSFGAGFGPAPAEQVGFGFGNEERPERGSLEDLIGATLRVERALAGARAALDLADLWLASAAVDRADPKRNAGFVKWGGGVAKPAPQPGGEFRRWPMDEPGWRRRLAVELVVWPRERGQAANQRRRL